MAEAPLLSLVLACYNEAEHLGAASRRSATTLEQSRFSFEILFVDDGSRDRTREIIASLVERAPAAGAPRDPARAQPGARRHRQRRLPRRARRVRRLPGRRPRGPRRYIPSLVRAIERGADVATRPAHLRPSGCARSTATLMSRGYSCLVRELLGVQLRDTETGYKFFRRARLLPRARRDPRTPAGSGTPSSWCGRSGAACASSRSREPTCAATTRRSTVRGVRDSFAVLRRLSLPARAAEPAVKALAEIGFARARSASALHRWPWSPTAWLLVPPLRAPWLRLLGARIGRRHRPARRPLLQPLPARPARPRAWAPECFLGDECLIDLAEGDHARGRR